MNNFVFPTFFTNKPNNKLFNKQVEFALYDKNRALNIFKNSILEKTICMFEYENLPESIPSYVLESMLQENGSVFITEVDNNLYAFATGQGGSYDVYFRPTTVTIANPALTFNATRRIDVDGVLIRNDSYSEGLLPLITKYGSLLVESELSMYTAIINSRDYIAYSADDEKTRKSIIEYQKQIYEGKPYTISSTAMMDSMKRFESTSEPPMQQLREMYQFIKAQLYNELGMTSSHNMKSQYVSDSENIVNNDSVMLRPYNMLKMRLEGISKINALYGLDIKVRFNSTWELQHEKIERSIRQIKTPDIVPTEPTREDVVETAESLTTYAPFTFNEGETPEDMEVPTIDDDINKTPVVEDNELDSEEPSEDDTIEVTDEVEGGEPDDTDEV